MPRLTPPRAALVAGLLALVVYANAPRNRWALDDVPVIWQNPVAHSVPAAWAARFSPYWPPGQGHQAGLYRPAVIMSFAVDWTLFRGEPRWFHLHNVLLHAIAAALVVLVAVAWLPVYAALGAGVVFAVHPVHVEAVANVVGRAELLAAIGLLVAVLAFRKYRRTDSRRARAGWGAATLAAVALALLSKEHAVVAVVLLALDAWLAPVPGRRPGFGLLLLIASVTLAWYAIWQAIAGPYVELATAPGLRHLSGGQRLATMLPVYLEVLRLLTWPLRLAYDYSPQVVVPRTGLTAVALLGGMAAGAVVALGLLSRRRAPAVAFGILAGLATYAPISNLLLVSGTILGERTLYLFVLAPALTVGWILARAWEGRWRRIVLVGLGALLAVYGARSFTRTPFWQDSRNALIESVVAHPENYRARQELARQRELSGDRRGALADYLVAGALFEHDPSVATTSAALALVIGQERIALREARRAYTLDPGRPAPTAQLVAVYRALGWNDSALAVARAALDGRPRNVSLAATHLELHHALASPEWQRVLARARFEWLSGRPAAATRAFDRAAAALEQAEQLDGLCWEVRAARPMATTLRTEWERVAQGVIRRAGMACGSG
jgi:hypothetical protein